MNWYYAESGQQRGPVTEEALDQLIASGTIAQDSLVWHEGMEQWQPLAQVRPQSVTHSTTPSPSIPTPPATDLPPLAEGHIRCSECGGVFSAEDAIQFGQAWVCAGCKPLFVQKLKEGYAAPLQTASGIYAGFWIRLAAKLIDWVIISAIFVIPAIILLVVVGTRSAPPELANVTMIVAQLSGVVAGVAYNTVCIGRWGKTVGKMACSLKVITSEGQPPTYLRAFGRAWGEQLSGLICNIGYIIAAFDDEKRALHDHICGTRVVRD